MSDTAVVLEALGKSKRQPKTQPRTAPTRVQATRVTGPERGRKDFGDGSCDGDDCAPSNFGASSYCFPDAPYPSNFGASYPSSVSSGGYTAAPGSFRGPIEYRAPAPGRARSSDPSVRAAYYAGRAPTVPAPRFPGSAPYSVSPYAGLTGSVEPCLFSLPLEISVDRVGVLEWVAGRNGVRYPVFAQVVAVYGGLDLANKINMYVEKLYSLANTVCRENGVSVLPERKLCAMLSNCIGDGQSIRNVNFAVLCS